MEAILIGISFNICIVIYLLTQILKELKNIPSLVEQAVPKLLSMGSLDLLKDSILDVKLAGV